MNKRIKKKIHRRHGFKLWNNYWEDCVDRVIHKAIEGKTSGNNNIAYAVVSRKIRKRKILKLQLLTNCVPVSIGGTGGNEISIEFKCSPLAGSPIYTGEVTPDGYPSATEYFKSRGIDIPDSDSHSPMYKMLEMWRMNLELSARLHPIATLGPLPAASTLAIPTAMSIVEQHKDEVLQMVHEEKQPHTDYDKPTTSWKEML